MILGATLPFVVRGEGEKVKTTPTPTHPFFGGAFWEKPKGPAQVHFWGLRISQTTRPRSAGSRDLQVGDPRVLRVALRPGGGLGGHQGTTARWESLSTETQSKVVANITPIQMSWATFHVHSFRDPNLFRKPSKTQGNSWFLKGTMVDG